MVVDDESELSELIKDYLEEEKFNVTICHDGKEAVEQFRRHQPHLVVLDIMLPNLDGMEVCRIIRSESTVPIIMLSAKKTEVDKILGLGLGADDYVVKPFSPGEVVARVKAQLRQSTLLTPLSERKELLMYGDLEIDPEAYMVKLQDSYIEFSAKEFEVLRFFAVHPGRF